LRLRFSPKQGKSGKLTLKVPARYFGMSVFERLFAETPPTKARRASFRFRRLPTRNRLTIEPKRWTTVAVSQFNSGGSVVQKPKMIAPGPPDQLKRAHFVPPLAIELEFYDGSFSLPIEALGMPLDRIDWKTAKGLPSGTAMTVKAIKGEVIHIDAGTLRYLVDERYAAGIDAALDCLRLSRDELKELAQDPLPQRLRAHKDLRRESWK
jgi:hypothetical protein